MKNPLTIVATLVGVALCLVAGAWALKALRPEAPKPDKTQAYIDAATGLIQVIGELRRDSTGNLRCECDCPTPGVQP